MSRLAPRELILSSPRLTLRPFAPGDATDVFAAITPSLTRFMGWDPPASAEAFAEIWRAWLPAMDAATDFHFVVRSSFSGAFLGVAGLHDLENGGRNVEPELGIWIKEAAHGHGYGREAVRTVVAWCSRTFAVRSFRYPVATINVASRRLAEALNGTLVGADERPKFAQVVYRVPAP